MNAAELKELQENYIGKKVTVNNSSDDREHTGILKKATEELLVLKDEDEGTTHFVDPKKVDEVTIEDDE